MERDEEYAVIILEASVNAANQGSFDATGSRISHTCSLIVVVFFFFFSPVYMHLQWCYFIVDYIWVQQLGSITSTQ